ncbi:2OG-Fe(II) oxygenase [Altererythrobacter sp. ZODW24]|uniref:prolyl hydroxylase family protein n=1 Tax=Altererythrobacter sp. ZODW24 TaxID=2185142 RepID=UPI000DF783F3|nr:2OG-Fe(II) oxygenase [Altererythrobacter sp. ZODW24]
MAGTSINPAETVPDRDALKRVGNAVRKRLLADPQVYQLPNEQAEIFAVGDFISPNECTKLMTMIDAVARPSDTFEGEYAEKNRTSYSGDIDMYDPFVMGIERRIDDLMGMETTWGETIQGQRYLPGQEFKEHCDWFWWKEKYWQSEKKRGGQRSWTTMAFLNEVEEGGDTSFTRLGLSVEPKPGVLLIWNNADPHGVPNEMTMHAGTPVVAGTKYIFTKWYRTRPWGNRGK